MTDYQRKNLCFTLKSEINHVSALWAGTNTTVKEGCAWMTDWRCKRHKYRLTEWSSVRAWVCVGVCGSQQLQMKLAIKLSPLAGVCSRDSRSDSDCADAFDSPEPAPGCCKRGDRCRPSPLLIPQLIHSLHTLPSLHYHSGPPWQGGGVHLPVKLGGGWRGWRSLLDRVPGYPRWCAAGRWIG